MEISDFETPRLKVKAWLSNRSSSSSLPTLVAPNPCHSRPSSLLWNGNEFLNAKPGKRRSPKRSNPPSIIALSFPPHHIWQNLEKLKNLLTIAYYTTVHCKLNFLQRCKKSEGIIIWVVIISECKCKCIHSYYYNLGEPHTLLGGLWNATCGNATELIIAIFALMENKVDVVKYSLLGSILSNLLLVLGTSLLCGGIANQADVNIALLLLGLLCHLLPLMYRYASLETPLATATPTLNLSKLL
ncbi:Sodium/calcium exchanger membrane region, partial [Cynara cardunculus var. scolymus]